LIFSSRGAAPFRKRGVGGEGQSHTYSLIRHCRGQSFTTIPSPPCTVNVLGILLGVSVGIFPSPE